MRMVMTDSRIPNILLSGAPTVTAEGVYANKYYF
jgi:hypothetical protein